MRLPVRSARAINGKHPAAAGGRPCLADLEMLTYTISHDLKGPLFTITALGECLLEDLSPPIDERSQEYLRRLVDASRHMGKFIDGFAWLFVKDNGIGMAEAEHERAFGLFERLHPDDGYSGTGAGLSIVKRAVEAFDGRIWIEGAAGRGSTFPFTLPAWAGAITDEGAQQIRKQACEDAVETTHHSSRRGQP